MQGRRLFSLTLALGCLLLVLPNVQSGLAAQGGEILIPGDKEFKLELLSPISTATNKKGDAFSCRVLAPAKYAGALVSGSIKNLKRSGKVKGDSKMELEFQQIEMSGRTGMFKAQVKEVYDVVDADKDGKADTEGLVKGRSTVKRDVLKITAGAAIGAIIGGLLGGGKGAVIGAAAGGAIATTSTLATKGPDLDFKQGTQFVVLTNAPQRRNDARESPAPRTLTRAAPPSRVEVPSYRYLTYRGEIYSLNVPDNWREYNSNGTVTMAPVGAYNVYQGQPGYTHAVMIGRAPGGGRNLQQAAEGLVGGLLRTNTYLRQQGGYGQGELARRNALSAVLVGRWPATGTDEVIVAYTTLLRNGDLFYIITVVPLSDFNSYQSVFQNVVRSVQIFD